MIERRFPHAGVFLLGWALWLVGELSASAQTVPVADTPSLAIAGSIAVIPFTNLSGQPADDWIGAGIAEAVVADLSQLGLSVMGQGVIRDALMNHARGDRGVDPDDATVLAVCRRVGATWLVSGAF